MRAAKGRKGTAKLEEPSAPQGARVGVVVWAEHGEVKIDFEGNTRGPRLARVASTLDDAALQRAAARREEALLFFDGAGDGQPIIVALLRPQTANIDAVLEGTLPASPDPVARVDGKRVEITGQDEVVLRCGKASLTLRRDGKVVLRGVNVVNQADAVQKIRGGKVEIN